MVQWLLSELLNYLPARENLMLVSSCDKVGFYSLRECDDVSDLRIVTFLINE